MNYQQVDYENFIFEYIIIKSFIIIKGNIHIKKQMPKFKKRRSRKA